MFLSEEYVRVSPPSIDRSEKFDQPDHRREAARITIDDASSYTIVMPRCIMRTHLRPRIDAGASQFGNPAYRYVYLCHLRSESSFSMYLLGVSYIS